MYKASVWIDAGEKVECQLCHHYCKIREGRKGDFSRKTVLFPSGAFSTFGYRIKRVTSRVEMITKDETIKSS